MAVKITTIIKAGPATLMFDHTKKYNKPFKEKYYWCHLSKTFIVNIRFMYNLIPSKKRYTVCLDA
jgi:hypothetical protein